MLRFGKTNRFLLFVVAMSVALGWPGAGARAAVLQFDGECSLHHAILAANTDAASGGCPAGADIIHLTGDVTLAEELPAIESVIAIEGDGYSMSGDKRYRKFRIDEWSYGSGDPDVENELTINRLTLAEARADHGSALYIAIGAEVNIYESQLKDNDGAGIFQDGGTVKLFNSIIGESIQGEDCIGSFSQNHGNLIEDGSCDAALSDAPMLHALEGKLGHHPLPAESPAIDAADPEYCPPTDHLGTPRPQGAGCDIGAVEYIGE